MRNRWIRIAVILAIGNTPNIFLLIFFLLFLTPTLCMIFAVLKWVCWNIASNYFLSVTYFVFIRTGVRHLFILIPYYLRPTKWPQEKVLDQRRDGGRIARDLQDPRRTTQDPCNSTHTDFLYSKYDLRYY